MPGHHQRTPGRKSTPGSANWVGSMALVVVENSSPTAGPATASVQATERAAPTANARRPRFRGSFIFGPLWLPCQ
ncbi:hypothetical protein ACFPRL_19165 [Pseudoclavibacter helvolus]